MKKTLALTTAFVLLSFSIACEKGGEDDEDRSLDEHACDEAAAKLEECCPGVRADSIACRVETSSGGCDSRTTTRDVLIPLHDADECILHASCAELAVSGGVCETLGKGERGSYSTSGGDPSTTTSAVSVCPSLRSGGASSTSSSSSSSGGTTYTTPKAPTTGEENSDPFACSGFSTSCSELGVASCGSQSGCAVAGDKCIGASSPCSFHHDEGTCLHQSGCTWDPR